MGFDIPEPFQWDSSFDVGDAATNEEHKNLFKKIAALAADQQNAEILADLLAYVKLHFENEEKLMQGVSFAEFDAHKAIHEKFVTDCLAVKEINDDVINFLKNWLVNHIKGSDMKYKDAVSK